MTTLTEFLTSPVHACPPGDSGTMPCCGRTPFEVPEWHRMTVDPALVTCGKARQ